MGPLAWMAMLLAGTIGWLAWRLSDAAPHLSIDDRGILVRSPGPGWIRWEEIEGVYPPTLRDSESLLLRVRPGEGLSRRLRESHPSLRSRPGRMIDLRLDIKNAPLGPLDLLHEIVQRGRRCEASPIDPESTN